VHGGAAKRVALDYVDGIHSMSSMSAVKHYCVTPDMLVVATVHTEGLALWSVADGCFIKCFRADELHAWSSSSSIKNPISSNSKRLKSSKPRVQQSRDKSSISKKHQDDSKKAVIVGVKASKHTIVAWTQQCIFMFTYPGLEYHSCCGVGSTVKRVLGAWSLAGMT
jgi:hypothetical protein